MVLDKRQRVMCEIDNKDRKSIGERAPGRYLEITNDLDAKCNGGFFDIQERHKGIRDPI
jgi:hypothetical protein